MRRLGRLLSTVGAVVAAGLGTGAAGAAGMPGETAQLQPGDTGGWSEAARERLRTKAELQEFRLTFTKKKALEMDPNILQPQPGVNVFTKKALDPVMNPFTKKSLQEGLDPALNAFKKKGMMAPQIQVDPQPEGLLLPATPAEE